MRALFLLFALLFRPLDAFSYPELSRHGYANCTSCHLSPSGGGLLTPYGRELSKEIVSTWAKEGEQYFAYGAIEHDEKLLLGAFFRGLQAHREDRNIKVGRFILMQADAEAAYDFGKWAVAGTVGRQEIRSGLKSDGRLFSRRHYALYRVTDELSLRAGKFLRFYGLNDPNHNFYVRRDLNFGFDTETYNFEVAYLGETLSAYATYAAGSLDKSRYAPLQEDAVTMSTSYFFHEKQKIGLSAYAGADTRNKRAVAGPWLILELVPKLYLLSEFDRQWKEARASRAKQNGYVTSHRFNYEWLQGVIPFVTYERKQLSSSDPKQHAYGLGVQLFPRPHWEVTASWQREKLAGFTTDLLWLMLHFYL